MSAGENKSEGRLSRWSKRKLSPNNADLTAAPVAVAEAEVAVEAVPGAGNLNVRGLVKPMPPLAGPEDGEPAYAAAQPDALALLDLENAPENVEAAALQAFPISPEDEGQEDGKDVELTPEQQEAVKDLPPIDSLKKDSDFTPFFGPNIPDFLKRQAFKALWMSSPFFGFQDGLDDYAENFRIIHKILTAADSDYKPGRGYEAAEDEAKAEAEAKAKAEAEAEADVGDDETDVGDGDDDGEAEEDVAAADDDAEDAAPKEPRKSDVRPPDDAV